MRPEQARAGPDQELITRLSALATHIRGTVQTLKSSPRPSTRSELLGLRDRMRKVLTLIERRLDEEPEDPAAVSTL